ncbi:MAG: universal stress protein, partial [Chloroflexota bacterium]|nr:universal stress protein [Chloroflexota bacterium]
VFDAEIVLLHVRERGAPRTIHGELHLQETAEAQAYLDRLIASLPEGARAERHVHTVAEGDVAGSIARHTSELATDLVILTAHGRQGARGWLAGRIAQQVLRQSTTPVLLLRPETPVPETGELGSVLVSLDRTPEAEAVLPLAEELASRLGLPIKLLDVVPTVGTVRGDSAAGSRLSPLATAAVLDAEEENAVEYLRGLVTSLCARGVEASGEIARGDAVEVLAEVAMRPEVGLIAMASHGRAGLEALWSASVGAGVQARVSKPMLLVNPEHAVRRETEAGET